MTFQLDIKKHKDGITYLDTPGLADIKLRQQAAEAITKALKQDGIYQVFFVITLEAGRVRPEDMETIRLVLESASDIKYYSLIINKLSTPAYDRLLEDNAEQLKILVAELLEQINCKNEPPTILLLMHKFKLSDENDQFMKWEELNEFVIKAPSIKVKPACAKDIDGDPSSFQEKLDILNRQLDELRSDNERMRRIQKETEGKYRRLMCLELESKLKPPQQPQAKGPEPEPKERKEVGKELISLLNVNFDRKQSNLK